VRSLLAADLVDEAWVFTSTAVAGRAGSGSWPELDASRFVCVDERPRGTDIMRLWRRAR
jgi:riboflavin biosynthesis pyrimidine reductase